MNSVVIRWSSTFRIKDRYRNREKFQNWIVFQANKYLIV